MQAKYGARINSDCKSLGPKKLMNRIFVGIVCEN